jgi:hypothetical protein
MENFTGLCASVTAASDTFAKPIALIIDGSKTRRFEQNLVSVSKTDTFHLRA